MRGMLVSVLAVAVVASAPVMSGCKRVKPPVNVPNPTTPDPQPLENGPSILLDTTLPILSTGVPVQIMTAALVGASTVNPQIEVVLSDDPPENLGYVVEYFDAEGNLIDINLTGGTAALAPKTFHIRRLPVDGSASVVVRVAQMRNEIVGIGPRTLVQAVTTANTQAKVDGALLDAGKRFITVTFTEAPANTGVLLTMFRLDADGEPVRVSRTVEPVPNNEYEARVYLPSVGEWKYLTVQSYLYRGDDSIVFGDEVSVPHDPGAG